MSTSQHSNSQPPASTWTEPPWCGWIETTGDALLILEAARRGLIPRVTRRLVDSERKMITSGSVFVFDEDESGIKRWTDGFFWSPSRILGNFLLYRETDKRGSGSRGSRSDALNDQEAGKDTQGLSRPKADGIHTSMDKTRERILMGSLTNSYKFKPDGLMKKTFSLTIGGVSQHLISYYKVEDVESGRLRSPSSLPELASLDISPEYLDKTHFRNPPKVEMGPDGILRYRGEADDIDTSPSLLTAPLSGLPLLTDGRVAESNSAGKRPSRYGPYTSPSISKRPRKQNKTSSPDEVASTSSAEPQQSPQEISSPAVQQQQQQHQQPQQHTTYPDPNVTAAPQAPYPHYGMPGYYQMPGYPLPHPHMYPPPVPAPTSYPPSTVPPSSATPQQLSIPATQYPMHPHPGHGASMTDPSVQQAQQYYPYYPHPTYPGYASVAWQYASYPPQPQPMPQILPAPAVPENENRQEGSKDSDNAAGIEA
ncbi:hypothetical protein AMATHDRAFT_54865 [Amanita thiersii Skay4041]|uniref:Uncharacterized protein n=1 Tax=Amanita thiersii Skay4041 TaxID=703135 RepID=A0A2A9P021_9AGAR|nr:hypothetical protein AMATHDRAFT_54865 [Amanita thiersii Skay4041]